MNIQIIIALLSNMIQHFEYALFGLSSSILVRVFLPQGNIEDSFIFFYSLLLFSVLFKPLGSYIFGRIGDIYGRSKAFKIGIFISGLSSLLIGFIPSFDQIGYLSIFLLIICRISLIMTGHIDNVTIYITESIPKKYENLASGLISLSLQTGIFVASIAFYISNSFEQKYLWRLNFIISGLLGLLILLLRNKITESEEFKKYKENNANLTKSTDSLLTLIKNNRTIFLRSIIIHGSIGGIYNFYILFFANYVGHVIKITEISIANLSINIGIGLCAVLAPIAGILADRWWNAKKQIFFFLIINFFVLILNIILINNNHYSSIIHIMLMCIYPFFVVPIIVYMKGMFEIKIRMRLYGLSHTIGSTLLSSSLPLICSILSKSTSISFIPIIYLLFLNLLLLIFCPKK